jgi:hypothetical protein
MNQTTHPGKERIRQWLRNRRQNPGCLPTMEQIRSDLGWTSLKPYEVDRGLASDKAISTIKAHTHRGHIVSLISF